MKFQDQSSKWGFVFDFFSYQVKKRGNRGDDGSGLAEGGQYLIGSGGVKFSWVNCIVNVVSCVVVASDSVLEWILAAIFGKAHV
ncbi:hypothetical protein Pcinc_041300 [Petrolisthes cinctipes]|uniref:Uncharacterized protein n=1 Tax=Petrolisthes cinctipes TaxID=88211 RepID=A0AAE1EH33_PETCI|nr:hypothetical protein Pcinc_041300 [Petrolisthes cinctipes]